MKTISSGAKSTGRFSLKNFKIKPVFIGYIIAVIMAVVVFFTIKISFEKMEDMAQQNADTIELYMSRQDLYTEWQFRLSQQNANEQIKGLYIDYVHRIITEQYIQDRVPVSRRLTIPQTLEFAETIWFLANSGHYPTATYPDALFLPLAFAFVETRFINDLVGADGERSMLQFMESTAKAMYDRSATKTYNRNFWQIPREYIWLWFEYYNYEASNYVCDDPERQIRWSALAYNAGGGRRGMKNYFDSGRTIEEYLRAVPYSRPDADRRYNEKVYNKFAEYKLAFGVFNAE